MMEIVVPDVRIVQAVDRAHGFGEDKIRDRVDQPSSVAAHEAFACEPRPPRRASG